MRKGLRGLWTMRCRAPGRLPWKSLATFPPRVPSPTSSTELYSFRIISWKVKTNRITGQSTATGKVPLIKERFLSKQTGPPLPPLEADAVVVADGALEPLA